MFDGVTIKWVRRSEVGERRRNGIYDVDSASGREPLGVMVKEWDMGMRSCSERMAWEVETLYSM